ncbi:hypothetical protein [Plantactinospora sp. GCM10030261]|uniref:hypothetical protein n=1 Tax=Plantactinospora sp. GCM10030261 TaxID=3273420 RepID=UPI00360FECDD
MVRRLVVALLNSVDWAPPSIDPRRWRAALAEDVVDLLALLVEAEPAIAATPADRSLAESVAWPGTRIYEVPDGSVAGTLAAVTGDGYDQVAVIAADVPDLPGLVLGKLLRPLSSRPVAIAPAGPDRPGLLGIAVRLPAPAWLPTVDLDRALPSQLRAAAPRPGQVAVTPGWRRLRTTADLGTLDPAVPGWERTRALLAGTG